MKNKKPLTEADLPEDVRRKLREEVNKDEKVKKLREQWNVLVTSGQYAHALQIHQVLDGLESRVISEYLRQYEGEAERMDDLMKDMSDEDREAMNVKVNTIIFLCDMVETMVIDSNQLLHKYHPHHNIEMFDRLTEVGREAKEHVSFMAGCTNQLFQETFADCADELTELVENKTRAFVRKLRNKRKKSG